MKTLRVGDTVQSITCGFTRGMIGTIEEFAEHGGETVAFVSFPILNQQIAVPMRCLREAPRVIH